MPPGHCAQPPNCAAIPLRPSLCGFRACNTSSQSPERVVCSGRTPFEREAGGDPRVHWAPVRRAWLGQGGMHWKGGGTTPPSRAPQRMPSHCPSNAKCQLQWHL